jgi:myosin heavy subunit
MSEETTVTDAAIEEEIPQEVAEEVIDPGHLEGMSQEQKEQKHEPKEGSKRWNQVYREAKEEGRRADEAESKATAAASRIAELEAKIQAMSTQPVQPEAPQSPPVEERPPDTKLAELRGEVTALRAERRKSLEEEDGAKVAEIQDKIDDLKDEITAISISTKASVDQKAITSAMRQAETDNAINGFISENSWFAERNADGTPNQNYDMMKSGAAIALETSMSNTWTGSYSALLTEVARQVNERFDTPEAKPKPKLSAVAGVGGIKPPPQQKSEELSPELKVLAHKMFPDEADPEKVYADELRKIKGAAQ